MNTETAFGRSFFVLPPVVSFREKMKFLPINLVDSINNVDLINYSITIEPQVVRSL